MSCPYHLAFKASVAGRVEGDDLVLDISQTPTLRIRHPSRGFRTLVEALRGTGGREDVLCDLVAREAGDDAGAARFQYYLGLLDERGLVCRTVQESDGPFCTLVPANRLRFTKLPVGPAIRYVLSRFAYCRREGDAIVLESPLGWGRLILQAPESMALVQRLSKPSTAMELAEGCCGLSPEGLHGLLEALFNLNALREIGVDGIDPDEEVPPLALWEFHDLLFHARSRPGRHDNAVGATYRFLGRIDPLPARKPQVCGELIPLYAPDLASLNESDPPFTTVVEARRTVRQAAPEPLSAAQLGEFLFRAARVRASRDAGSDPGRLYETTDRPYPGAGAAFEVELYPLINRCAGIAQGLYHYDAFTHALGRLSGPTALTAKLLDDANKASGVPRDPDMLFVMTARFQRLSWKYASLAYSLVLKDVGVLFQQMYLVAAAMNLSPCALGCGDSDLFAKATGMDPLVEASVGEFVLGAPAASPDRASPAR